MLVAYSRRTSTGSGKRPVWKVELAGALNNYSAWEVEPTITYLPIPYAGITMGFLFCNTIEDESYSGVSKDQRWRWSSDDDSPLCHHFALRPAIQLATPPSNWEKIRIWDFPSSSLRG